jgi:hypothetical protein
VGDEVVYVECHKSLEFGYDAIVTKIHSDGPDGQVISLKYKGKEMVEVLPKGINRGSHWENKVPVKPEPEPEAEVKKEKKETKK